MYSLQPIRNWIPSSIILALGSSCFLELHAQTPAPRNAVIVLTVENRVEILRVRAQRADPAYTNQVLDAGDRGRTYENSRVTLRMPDLSVARFNENSSFQVEAPPSAGARSTLSLLKGLVYFLHRDKPVEVKVRTPAATAAIRGTEFVLEHRDDGRTILTLVDGEVELSNLQGESLGLKSGEQGMVEPGKPPVRTAVIDATNIIQWCLYYPAVLNLAELDLTAAEREALAPSLNAYRSGDLLAALKEYPAGREPVSASERIYYGALLLAVGQVERGSANLESVAAGEERAAALARALQKLVAAVKQQPHASAMRSPASSSLSTENLAESYYHQSRSRLEEALMSARKSVQISPGFGFGWARVAELEFSFGRIQPAKQALEKSLAIAPRNAQALALKGFVLAAQNRIAEAITWFDRAIAVDGALANAWLGRGLCLIRQGRREAGRADLQTAAALEPNRSVLRSYLGKALGHVSEDTLAEKEFALAKRLDANDPTPWLYSALQSRQQNQINAAVRDLEKSIDLNNNRSVYRSHLLLDQDRSVRSANLANIYQSAGLSEVSVREAARAVNADYANYSAHLFLAESFDALRDPTRFNLRYETAWFNERLLANLLAPVGAGPVSQNISQQEYFRLFETTRFGFSSLTDYRSDGQVRELASQFGTIGNTSYALDLDYQHNDGVRPNNELDRIEWYTTIKQQLTPQDSILLMTKYQDYHSGDNFQYYDPRDARRHFSYDEYQAPIVVGGYHREWTPGVHTLFLGGRLENDQRFKDRNAPLPVFFKDPAGEVVAIGNIGFDARHRSELEIYTGELNQIFQSERQVLVMGGRFQIGEFETHSVLSNPSTASNLFNVPPADHFADDNFKRISAYGYYTLELPLRLRMTGGASYDYVRFPENFRSPPIQSGEEDRERVSPKAALVWDPIPEMTLRGVYTRSLGGVSLDESFRLEPVQLAGFSQAYRTIIPESLAGSVAAPEFETWGAAMDVKLKTRTYLGVQAELLDSEVRQTAGVFDYNDFTAPIVPSSAPQRLDFEERSITASLHQLIGEEWSMGIQYRFARAELDSRFPRIPNFLPESRRKDQADLQRLETFALFNHPSGFFARAESQWYWQHNAEASAALEDDSFVQWNFFLGYRFPRQRATITLGILNVTDEDYRLNPLNVYTELPRERVFTARLLINF